MVNSTTFVSCQLIIEEYQCMLPSRLLTPNFLSLIVQSSNRIISKAGHCTRFLLRVNDNLCDAPINIDFVVEFPSRSFTTQQKNKRLYYL